MSHTDHWRVPASRRSSHLQTQLQNGYRLTFAYISFSSFTLLDAPYRIILLFLPRLPYHFYIVVIEQQLTNYIIENATFYKLAKLVKIFDHVLIFFYQVGFLFRFYDLCATNDFPDREK